MPEPTLEELQLQVTSLIEEKNALTEANEALEEEVAALKQELAIQKHQKIVNRKTFTFEDKTYSIMAKQANINGVVISDETIATDTEIQEHLLDIAWEGRTEGNFNSNGLLHLIID